MQKIKSKIVKGKLPFLSQAFFFFGGGLMELFNYSYVITNAAPTILLLSYQSGCFHIS